MQGLFGSGFSVRAYDDDAKQSAITLPQTTLGRRALTGAPRPASVIVLAPCRGSSGVAVAWRKNLERGGDSPLMKQAPAGVRCPTSFWSFSTSTCHRGAWLRTTIRQECASTSLGTGSVPTQNRMTTVLALSPTKSETLSHRIPSPR